MLPLNAVDAISPAFTRTKQVLFSPFRFGRTWKLGVTGYLAFAGTFFFPFQLVGLAFLARAQRAGGTSAVALLVFGVLLLTAIGFGFFYLFARLHFAFFDIVLHRGEFVAPAWGKYGRQTWQWIGLMVSLGTLSVLAMLPAAIAYIRGMISLFKTMSHLPPGQPPPASFFIGFYGGYFVFYGLMLLAVLLCTTLSAFLVPSLALEDVSLLEAFRRFFYLIRLEPGQFLGFVAMRAVLGIAGYIVQLICFEVVFLLQILGIGVVALLIGIVLHLAHVPTPVLIVLGVTLAVLLYLFNLVYVMLGSFGILVTFMQAHALYFLAGRYPLLGDLLDSSTPPPPSPAQFPLQSPPDALPSSPS